MFLLSRAPLGTKRPGPTPDTERSVATLLGADIAPQRPRVVRDRTEPSGHILEPEWSGTRVLVRIGGGPRFRGYAGEVEGPRELYDAIVADARCETAIIDGVLVTDWRDESDLEMDDQGNAYTRQFGAWRWKKELQARIAPRAASHSLVTYCRTFYSRVMAQEEWVLSVITRDPVVSGLTL